MAVVATPSKGHDLDYIWKNVDRGPAKDAAGYYIQASDSGENHPAAGAAQEQGPSASSPAAWHEALAALGPVDGPDVRGMPDGLLLHLRDAHPAGVTVGAGRGW